MIERIRRLEHPKNSFAKARVAVGDKESSPGQELGLRFNCSSIPSIIHPDRNEDHIEVMPDQSLAMLFDGSTGLDADGKTSSEVAADFVSERLKGIPSQYMKAAISNALIDASNEVCEKIPGTKATAVVAKFIENAGQKEVIIGSVGDTRAYILREGKLIKVTEDDRALSVSGLSGLSDEDKQRIDQKLDQISSKRGLTPDQLHYWEQRNWITQTLGDKGRPPSPHLYQVALQKGDKVILTSDGVYKNLTTKEIEKILNSKSPDLALELAKKAKARSVDKGHARSMQDDVSAVVIDVEQATPQALVKKEQTEESSRGSGRFKKLFSGIRFDGEAVKKVAKESWERATNVHVLGQSVIDVATGGAIGFSTRTAVHLGLTSFGAAGIVPIAVGGAVGGVAVEVYKRGRQERKGYGELTRKLADEFKELTSGEFGLVEVGKLVNKYQELETQRNQTQDRKEKELLYDQLRYLAVYIKRKEKGTQLDGKALLDSFFESKGTEIAPDQTEADRLFKAIKESRRIDKGRMAWGVGRAFLFGTAGSIGGVKAADWFAHEVIPNINENTPVIGGISNIFRHLTERGVPTETAGTPVPNPTQQVAPPTDYIAPPSGGIGVEGGVPDVVQPDVGADHTVVPPENVLPKDSIKIPDIPPSIAAQPEIIPLSKGSNGWEMADRLVKEAGGKGTFDEIKAVAYALCKASGVAVPNWDLPGQIDHRFLPVDFQFHDDTDVKVILTQIHYGNLHS